MKIEKRYEFLNNKEAFEKCWAHSPLQAAALPFTRCRYCRTLARRLRIDVHDDDNDNNNDNDNT